MRGLDRATTVSAWIAILVSLLTSRQSLKLASRLVSGPERHDLHAAQGQTIVSFTNQYTELVRDGERFEDDDWALRYWALIATEFYFFDHGWLPSWIYELWTIELVTQIYDAHPEAWESHERHMARFYAVTYPRMSTFFTTVHELARRPYPAPEERSRAIATFVQSQHATGRRRSLDALA